MKFIIKILAIAFICLFSTGSSYALKRYWIGNGSSFNWNNTANWSAASGGAGGASVPGSSDTAYFDSGRKCIINATVSIKRLEMAGTFTDTIVQNRYAITIGSTGASINGGKFLGDSLDIIMGGVLTINGGTFRSTKTALYFRTGFTFTSGSFLHNNGYVRFENTCTINGNNTTIPFYDLGFTAVSSTSTYTYTIASGTTLNVARTLYLTRSGYIVINTGNINVQGDLSVSNSGSLGGGSATITVNGTGNQTLTGSGLVGKGNLCHLVINKSSGILYLNSLISVKGNWTYSAGTVDAATNNSTVALCASSTLDAQAAATMSFNHLRINTGTIALAGAVNVLGDLTLASGTVLNTNNYAINTGGHFDNSGTFNAGTSVVTLNGSSEQLIKGSSATTFYSLRTLGTSRKTLSRDITVQGTLTLSNNSLNLDTHKINITNTATSAISRVKGYVSNTGNGKLTRSTASTGAYTFPLAHKAANDSVEYFLTNITPGKISAQSFTASLINNRGLFLSYDKALYGTDPSTVKITVLNTAYDTLKLEMDINSSADVSALRVYDPSLKAYTLIPSSFYTLTGGNNLTFPSLNPLLLNYSTIKLSSSLNWVYAVTYGENNLPASESIQYVDKLGRATQAQVRDLADNTVIVSQTIYDAYGRGALQTLPAPTNTLLQYKSNFITSSSGAAYNYTHFDLPATLNNPDPVQNTIPGTLGHYYSNNGMENYIATTSYPYSRTEFEAGPGSPAKRTAGPGDEYRMGNAKNTEARSFSMTSGDELKFIFQEPSPGSFSYKVSMSATDPLQTSTIFIPGGIVAGKVISIDADGKEVISYAAGGSVIASCFSGLPAACTMENVTSLMHYHGTRSVEIHIPKSKKQSLELPLPQYRDLTGTFVTANAQDISYILTDVNTNKVLMLNTDYVINTDRTISFFGEYNSTAKSSFLRISFMVTEGLASILASGSGWMDVSVVYDLDYSGWSINYYDIAGRLRKEVSAKGASCTTPGVHTMATVFDYSSVGQLITKQSPDEGKSEMVYDREGKLRFSQNIKQAAENTFSYVCYDAEARAIESGVSPSSTSGVLFQNYYGSPACSSCVTTGSIINNTGTTGLPAGRTEQSFVSYNELAAADKIPTTDYTYGSNYTQKYLMGAVSKTRNENTISWYSYDQFGRQTFLVQQLLDPVFTAQATGKDDEIKTIDYVYNLSTGALKETIYQKWTQSSERLSHLFYYDNNLRLTQVNVKIGTSAAEEVQAKYYYYKTGALKRKELGDKVQGVDYVYTINGQLKSMNHPALIGANDPGKDGETGTANALFAADIFGFTLDYHQNDYTRSGTSITSSSTATSPGFYSGLIHALRYRTRAVTNGFDNGADKISYENDNIILLSSSTDQLMHRYSYDDKNQLSISTFGIYNNGFTASDNYKEYGTSITGGISYDANGNIVSLKRNGYNGSYGLVMDDLSYTYASNNNMLSSITDNAASSYIDDFDAATAKTFAYTELGQMKGSAAENVHLVEYYTTGKTKKVTFTTANNSYTEYFYNDKGMKLKAVYVNRADLNNIITKSTWFITDAAGTIIAVYEKKDNASAIAITEQPIYGAGRIGAIDKTHSNLIKYELTDHLGNVRATVCKAGVSGTGQTIAELTNRTDYYAFGGTMPGRSHTSAFGVYRYAYQGQEKAEQTNWSNFELRMFNSHLGRWFAPDPYGQFHSPYIGMANNPVSGVDPDGGWINMNSDGSITNKHGTFKDRAQYERWMAISPEMEEYRRMIRKIEYEIAYDEFMYIRYRGDIWAKKSHTLKEMNEFMLRWSDFHPQPPAADTKAGTWFAMTPFDRNIHVMNNGMAVDMVHFNVWKEDIEGGSSDNGGEEPFEWPKDANGNTVGVTFAPVPVEDVKNGTLWNTINEIRNEFDNLFADENFDWEGFDQGTIDFAGTVIGGLTTVFQSAAYYSELSKVAVSRIGVPGTVASVLTYAHANMTDQAKRSHHIDIGATAFIFLLTAYPPTMKYGLTLGFMYGGARLIGGEILDNWINNTGTNPTLQPNKPK